MVQSDSLPIGSAVVANIVVDDAVVGGAVVNASAGVVTRGGQGRVVSDDGAIILDAPNSAAAAIGCGVAEQQTIVRLAVMNSSAPGSRVADNQAFVERALDGGSAVRRGPVVRNDTGVKPCIDGGAAEITGRIPGKRAPIVHAAEAPAAGCVIRGCRIADEGAIVEDVIEPAKNTTPIVCHSVDQGEAAYGNIISEKKAAQGMAAVDDRGGCAVDALQSERFGHGHTIGRVLEYFQTAGLINTVA